jgi:TATA-box binding protein (TBP) (component of TFIID and TFIIIB)
MSSQDFFQPDFLPINPHETIKLENITVSCNIDTNDSLQIITEQSDFQLEDSNPHSLGGAKQNLSDGALLRLHSSGELVCVGFCDPKKACLAISECVNKLAQNGLCTNSTPTRVIVNMFASAVIGKQIMLRRLGMLAGDEYEYEPEQMNSMSYTRNKFDRSKYHEDRCLPQVSANIFSSGRIQIFGATHRQMIHAVIHDILSDLEEECVY